MPVTSTVEALEQSTFGVTVSAFTDTEGTSVTPTAFTWTLTRKSTGEVVNSREDVSETPAASVRVVLSGDDLARFTGDDGMRLLTMRWTYDSDDGNGMVGYEVLTFFVRDLEAVS
jgi:hypothetical protein